MSLYDTDIAALDGTPGVLKDQSGKVTLVVNVASKCGLTPQYTQLEELQGRFADQGFTVLGVPCNQFGAQEPGSPDEIATFCSTNYGVSFPLTEKVEVNGDDRHPLYDQLTPVADTEGESGDIRWNFEKFLVGRDGSVVARFNPMTAPDDEAVVGAIEGALCTGPAGSAQPIVRTVRSPRPASRSAMASLTSSRGRRDVTIDSRSSLPACHSATSLGMSRGAQHDPSSEPTRRFSVNIASAGTIGHGVVHGSGADHHRRATVADRVEAGLDERCRADGVEGDIGADARHLHDHVDRVLFLGVDHVGRAEAQSPAPAGTRTGRTR